MSDRSNDQMQAPALAERPHFWERYAASPLLPRCFLLGIVSFALTVIVAIPFSLLFGSSAEAANPVLDDLAPWDMIKYGVFIGPLLETLVFQWFLLIFLSWPGWLLLRKWRNYIDWLPILICILVFAGVHSFNVDPPDWRSGFVRIVPGIMFTVLMYVQLRFTPGSRWSAHFKAIVGTWVVHAVHNGVIILPSALL